MLGLLESLLRQHCERVEYPAPLNTPAPGLHSQDPHFKAANHRRRIIQTNLLAEYAYIMAPGAKLYTITDVEELGIWMVRAGEYRLVCFFRCGCLVVKRATTAMQHRKPFLKIHTHPWRSDPHPAEGEA